MSVSKTDLLLGQGELYFKREGDASGVYKPVGNLKGPVTFSHEIEFAEQQPGNRITIARRDKISEKASLTAGVGDFKISQLIAALGQSISTTQITNTHTLRAWEELAFGSTTTVKSISRTPVSLTSVVVTTMDQVTQYVNTTHYSMTSTGGKKKLKPLTTTTANKTVHVSFDFADTGATVMRVGDKLTLQTVDLKFTHKLSDGKFITIEIPKASIMGGLEVPFSDQEHTTYNIVFGALGDMAAAPGESLFNIIRES